MKEFDLFGFQVEIDEVATKEWYDNADEWGCECGDCRHFVALAKKRKLPSAVMEILEQLGIVPEKATYVCEILTEEHKVLYQFSYRIAGNILKERAEDIKDFGWGEAYCGHEPYPYGAPGFPAPHFDLEFWVRLPKGYKYSDIADFLMHEKIREYILEKHGLKVSTLCIAQIKDKCGLQKQFKFESTGENKVPQCTPKREEVIMDAFRHFGII